MHVINKKGYATKKQPEQEILSIAHRISSFASSYKKQVAITLSSLAVLLVIAAGYWLMKNLEEQKAAPLLAAAYEYYSSAAGASADYGKALALFGDAQKKYPGTMSGAVAQYYIGNCLVNLNRPEEAIKEYQTFVTKYAADKLLLGLVYQRMGYVYNALGKQADAMKSFEQSESLMGPGPATMELARLYETSGNVVEAQRKYKIVSEKLAGTSWGIEATGKVQKIESVPQPFPGKSDK